MVHIASVIAHVHPFAVLDIQRWLETKPGVEIHAVSDQGKLVIVIEAAQEQAKAKQTTDAKRQLRDQDCKGGQHAQLNQPPRSSATAIHQRPRLPMRRGIAR